jgi:hypothetical protein
MDDITTLSGTFLTKRNLLYSHFIYYYYPFSFFIIESFPIVRYPGYTNSSALYVRKVVSLYVPAGSIIAGLYSVYQGLNSSSSYNKYRIGFLFLFRFPLQERKGREMKLGEHKGEIKTPTKNSKIYNGQTLQLRTTQKIMHR